MIFIWRGYGWFTLLIPIFVLFAVGQGMRALFGVEFGAHYGHYELFLCMALSAVLIWVGGRQLNKDAGQVFVNEQTGKRLVLPPQHSLFFLRMEYWAIPVALLGVAFLFAKP